MDTSVAVFTIDLQVKQKKSDITVESDKFDPFSLTAKDADAAIIEFLKKVKKFQDRAWKKNPTKV